jgi:hypothetical protein
MRVKIEGKEYEFDQKKLPLAEAIALEKVTGMRLPEWNEDFEKGSMLALAGMVWLILRRNGEQIKFSEIEDGSYPIDLAGIEWNRDDEDEPGGQDGEAASDPTAEDAPAVEGAVVV